MTHVCGNHLLTKCILVATYVRPFLWCCSVLTYQYTSYKLVLLFLGRKLNNWTLLEPDYGFGATFLTEFHQSFITFSVLFFKILSTQLKDYVDKFTRAELSIATYWFVKVVVP